MGDPPFADRRHDDHRYYRLEQRLAMVEKAILDGILQDNKREEQALRVEADHENRLRDHQDLASELKGSLKVLNWLIVFFGAGGVGGIVVTIIKLSH